MNTPLLSVCLITYNHEKFIRQAIESVLMQKVNFSWELIIAEDCSTDNTKAILNEYKEKYPDFIKLILQEKNVGPAQNWIDLMAAPKSKYIAYIDGDDYWTDSLKLQKQVDFLESNSDYVLTFHNAEVLNIVSGMKSLFVDNYASEVYNSKDIFEKWLIPSASMVFRNVLNKNLPEFLVKATHGDLALQVYLNEFGKFHASNDVMCTYRINENSVTINSFSNLKHNNKHIEQLKLMNVFFNKKYDIYIKRRMFLYYLRNANCYRKESIKKPLYWILKSVVLKPSLVFYYKNQFIYSLKNVFFTFKVFLNLKKE